MPYNPLEAEVIKNVIVPCLQNKCIFYWILSQKKCGGILYNGELNDDVIIVCEKFHTVNIYERFILF